MPWTLTDQAAAEKVAHNFESEFNDKMTAWRNALLSGGQGQGQGQGAVDDVLLRWRQSVNSLKSQSEIILSSESVMDSLGTLANEIADEKNTLQRLRNEAVTRSDQSDSVNPKVRGSPYTNILGLQRTFRESTRFNILMVSILFGILALGALGALVVAIVQSGSIATNGFQQGGGWKRAVKRHFVVSG